MTLSSSISLFFAMVVLAITPGPGILIVMARTLSHGLTSGAITAIGVASGDFVWITMALMGLTALSGAMGEWFVAIKYLGAAYLIWLGISLLIKPKQKSAKSNDGSLFKKLGSFNLFNHGVSFLAGFLTTMANPKAMMFYVSFLPAFVDLSSISLIDSSVIYVCAGLAVGGVMFAYAVLAHKTRRKNIDRNKVSKVDILSAIVLIACGLYVGAKP